MDRVRNRVQQERSLTCPNYPTRGLGNKHGRIETKFGKDLQVIAMDPDSWSIAVLANMVAPSPICDYLN